MAQKRKVKGVKWLWGSLALLFGMLFMFGITTNMKAYAKSTTESISYLDSEGNTQNNDCSIISSSSTSLNTGWYAVKSEVIIDNDVICDGEVNIVLTDDSKLTINGQTNEAVSISDGSKLTIYGQTAGTGSLIVNGKKGADGDVNISSFDSGKIGTVGVKGGSFVVNGGTITVNGGNGGSGVQNGGVNPMTGECNGGISADGSAAIISNVTVNGGTLNANGGNAGNGGSELEVDPMTGVVTCTTTVNVKGAEAIVGNLTLNGGTASLLGGDGGDGGYFGLGGDGASAIKGDLLVVNDGLLTLKGGAAGNGGLGAEIDPYSGLMTSVDTGSGQAGIGGAGLASTSAQIKGGTVLIHYGLEGYSGKPENVGTSNKAIVSTSIVVSTSATINADDNETPTTVVANSGENIISSLNTQKHVKIYTPKYTITKVTEKNGSYSTNVENAPAGTEVTITTTPNNGYVVDKIIVKDQDGNIITVTDNKFAMPSSNVTIEVTFKAISSISLCWLWILLAILFILLGIYTLGYIFLYRRGKLDDKAIRVIYKFLPRGNKNKKQTE